jgi:hypothetical protein
MDRSGVLAVGLVAVYLAGTSVRVSLLPELPTTLDGALGDYGLLVAFSASAGLGALLVWKRPGHPLGWLLTSVGVMVAVFPAMESYAAHRMTTVGEPNAVATLGAWFNNLYWMPLLSLLLVFIPLLFPDGHLPSPRWRWLTRMVTVSLVGTVVPSMFLPTLTGQDVDYAIPNPIGIAALEGWESSPAFAILALGIVVGLVGAIVSVAIRFRRSHGVERQQVKWLLLAVSPGPLLPFVEEISVLGQVMLLLNLVGVPLAITFAVLRYRLYDVDRIISRTLGYVLLSAILVGIYVAGVLGLGAVARTLTGRTSDVVVALSTLLVAAAFQPVRRRVRTTVDRRFNRARYDAQRTSEDFAQRLRDEVDLTELRGDLATTVRASLAPATLAVWLPEEEAT